MSYNRNLDYLIKHRVIYRRLPINDKPTDVYSWGNYYKNGTFECYDMFKNKAKINTFKSLKWHLLVLWYLNPKITQNFFENLASYITNKLNGFVTFNVSDQLLKTMIYEVSMSDLDKPPNNRSRKIIFNEFSGLTTEEKLVIVGQMVGREKKVNEDDIYQAMLDTNDAGKKITITSLSKLLNCSTRTIHRNMGNTLKKEKELMNNNKN
tara:strand:+ start:537 stop:1160 length:624 start_codon:yes stop_codon:yes gene_type:complete